MRKIKAIIQTFFCITFVLVLLSPRVCFGEEANTNQKQVFSISYKIIASSTNNKSNSVNPFSFLPRVASISWGENSVRIDELGGINNGSTIANFAENKSFYLNHKNRKFSDAGFWNIDSASEEIKAIMTDHYKVEMEDTGETKKILGHNSKKYRVTRSAFIAPESEAYIWVTDDLEMRPSRFEFRANAKRILSPLPVLLGNKTGVILRMEVKNKESEITYIANKIEFKDKEDYFFKIPKNYKRLDPLKKAVNK